MDNEYKYKLEMALKEIERLREVVHKLEIDTSIASERSDAQTAAVAEKINLILGSMRSVSDRVDSLTDSLAEGKDDGVKRLLKKYSVSIQLAFITLLLIVKPESIKAYITNSLL